MPLKLATNNDLPTLIPKNIYEFTVRYKLVDPLHGAEEKVLIATDIDEHTSGGQLKMIRICSALQKKVWNRVGNIAVVVTYQLKGIGYNAQESA